ncbi:MAG: hypothetical protein ACYCO5_02685 [Acidobacteriaceae bacterium]
MKRTAARAPFEQAVDESLQSGRVGQMGSNFDDKIAALEAKIAEADMVKAMFAQFREFSRRLLVDRATAWEQANIDQKQGVQNVLFPDGPKYRPKKWILGRDNECLFN